MGGLGRAGVHLPGASLSDDDSDDSTTTAGIGCTPTAPNPVANQRCSRWVPCLAVWRAGCERGRSRTRASKSAYRGGTTWPVPGLSDLRLWCTLMRRAARTCRLGSASGANIGGAHRKFERVRVCRQQTLPIGCFIGACRDRHADVKSAVPIDFDARWMVRGMGAPRESCCDGR